MKLVIFLLFFINSESVISQIRVDTSYMDVSQSDSKSCGSARYIAKIPVIKCKFETIKLLNDTIYSIYKQVYNEFYNEIKFPSYEEAFDISSCYDVDGRNRQIDEETKTFFQIFSLSDSLISICIIETITSDGYDVVASNEKLYSLNFNLKTGEFIDWKKQVSVNDLKKARLLLAKNINQQLNRDKDSIALEIPEVEDIENVCLSKDKIRVFAYTSFSQHGWFEFVDIPLEKKKSLNRKVH